MPLPGTQDFSLRNEDQATRFGAALGLGLLPGDTVLFSGPVGAGKSHLARAAIRARLGAMVDVPSPSFTLVQTYDAPDFEIWHADLYRLTGPDEVAELGLSDAMGQQIVMIEWPDRLGALAPAGAVRIALQMQGDGRLAQVRGARDGLLAALRGALA